MSVVVVVLSLVVHLATLLLARDVCGLLSGYVDMRCWFCQLVLLLLVNVIGIYEYNSFALFMFAESLVSFT